MDYSELYISSFHKAITRTEYFIAQGSISGKEWFEKLIELTAMVANKNGRIFFFGNGASAAFANHMALDWSKNGKVDAYSLSDSALLTALSNDYSYKEAFSQFLNIRKVGPNDMVATISSSGNSKNVVNALKLAKKKGVSTVSFSALKPDNQSRSISDFALYVPCRTYGFAECAHQLFLHLWLDQYMDITEWDRQGFQNMNSEQFSL